VLPERVFHYGGRRASAQGTPLKNEKVAASRRRLAGSWAAAPDRYGITGGPVLVRRCTEISDLQLGALSIADGTRTAWPPLVWTDRRVTVARARPRASSSLANVSMSARRSENIGSERERHQPVNWRRLSA